MSVAHPPKLRNGILKNGVQIGHCGILDFAVALPQLPAFSMYGACVIVGHFIRVVSDLVLPECLCQSVHVHVQLGDPRQRIVSRVVILVSFDMEWEPFHPTGLD